MKLVKIGRFYFNPEHVVAVVNDDTVVRIFMIGDPKPFAITKYTFEEVIAILEGRNETTKTK